MQNSNIHEYSRKILQNIELLKLENLQVKTTKNIDYIDVFSTISNNLDIANIQEDIVVDSIAKDLLVKENKLLKSKCEKWQTQNRSLELINDKLQVKLESQINSNSCIAIETTNSMSISTKERSDKDLKCLKSEIDLCKDIVHKIQSQNNHEEHTELRQHLDNTISKFSLLKQELSLEINNKNNLHEAQCKLITDLSSSKAIILDLTSKVNVMEGELKEVQTQNNKLIDTCKHLQSEILSERNTILKLSSTLLVTEEAAKITKESLKSSELARKQIMQSYENEIHELKAIITALQDDLKKREQHETKNTLEIKKPNILIRENVVLTKAATNPTIPSVTEVILDNTDLQNITSNISKKEGVCPSCKEAAYGLMVKCHSCLKEFHLTCSRKINQQFICEPCLKL